MYYELRWYHVTHVLIGCEFFPYWMWFFPLLDVSFYLGGYKVKQLWIQRNGRNYLYEIQETKEAKNYLDLIMKNYELYEIQKEENPNEILEGFIQLFKEEEDYTVRKFEEKNKKFICYVPSALNSIMEEGLIQLDTIVDTLLQKEDMETLNFVGHYLVLSHWKEKNFDYCNMNVSIKNTIGYYKLFKAIEQEMDKNKVLIK